MVIEICKQNNVLWSKFHHHVNNMEFLMKYYIINHSHYHHLIRLIKRAVKVSGMRCLANIYRNAIFTTILNIRKEIFNLT